MNSDLLSGWAWSAILLALGTAFVLWTLSVRHWYRMVAPRPTLLETRCADGWKLGVFYRPAAVKRFAEPVILAHGLSVTHLNLDFEPPYSVAHVLCDAGFDCFAVDWRGNGASATAPPGRHPADYCADDHINLDAPAVLALALEKSGARQALWVGHSLGGLVGYGLAERAEGARLRGIVTLGSPAFFLDPSPRMKRIIRLSPFLAWPRSLRQRTAALAVAPLLGWIRLPLADAVVNPAHVEPWLVRKLFANLFVAISRKMLLQFRDWILNGAFRSLDGTVDYREKLADLRLPALVIAGARDQLATPRSVAAAFERLSSTDKTLVVFGREHGDQMDYGHGDLVFGRGAPTEVFPLIRAWLEAHATPQGEAGTQVRTQGEPGVGSAVVTRDK